MTEPNDENDFEPGQYGYKICKISIDGHSLFESYIDDDQSVIYAFSKNLSKSQDYIIHDIDQVHGFSGGNLCIGVIPHCTDKCQVNFQWYCNDDLFREGSYLQIISHLPEIDGDCTFYCKMLCKTTNNLMTSKKIVLTKEQRERGRNKPNQILDWTKHDFTINIKNSIGAGGQGKVYEGSLSGKK